MYLKLVLAFTIFLRIVYSNPCSQFERLDITSGEIFENGSVIHDGIEYGNGLWFKEEVDNQTLRFGCPCIGRICFWKCCEDGHMFFNKSCTDTDQGEVNPFKPTVYKGKVAVDVDATKNFFYMHNQWLCTARYLVDPLIGDELYLQENGTLYEISSEGNQQWHASTSFCMDMMVTDASLEPRQVALVCHPEEIPDDDNALYIAYAIGLLLSVPFLLATFLVYAFIPELRNLHGLCLMAYCSGLIVAYPLLAYLKLLVTNVTITYTGCMVIAFIIYYSFQTSFFWLNVMCFDIWRTFSGYRGSGGNKRERKRFILYGAYAWGVPLALTCVVIGMQYSESLPSNVIRPGFGDRRCWFEDWLSELVYFFAPVLVLVVCNVVLFSVTAYRIRSIRQETAILKSSESSRSDKLIRDKQRYALYLKLFVVMGVNWTIEVISFGAGGTNWYWIIVDISNIGLGIFIFFIFVWKNRVRTLVWRKIATWRGASTEGTSGYSESQGTGRWATRSSTAATEVTRVFPSDDPGVRLKDLR